MLLQIAPVFFSMDIPATLAYLHRKAWFRMFGDVAGSAGLRHRGARPVGDSFPLRRAAHRQSGQVRGRIARLGGMQPAFVSRREAP